MESVAVTAVTLALITGCCAGQNVLPPGPVNGAVGGNVTFTTTINPSTTPQFNGITWTFRNASVSVNVITSVPGGETPGVEYTGRVSVNRTTGSLELRQLTLGDAGEYTVQLTPVEAAALNGSTTLRVYEIISGANITGPTAELIAGNSSAILSCQATAGTITSREWLKDGQPLSPSNTITISGDNSSVSINPVEGSDNGQYQCKLTNPVSTDTVSYTLIVIYGPLDAVILGGDTAAVGSTVVLYCSAPSVPPPAFAWEVNGTQTGVRTAVYVIEMSNNTDSGTYTCLATNDITGLSASARHELTVKAEAPSCPTPALTPAEAAGVTIGVTAGVALLVLAVYFGIRHFRIKSNDSGQETAGNNTERATVQGGEGSSGKPSPKVYRTGLGSPKTSSLKAVNTGMLTGLAKGHIFTCMRT